MRRTGRTGRTWRADTSPAISLARRRGAAHKPLSLLEEVDQFEHRPSVGPLQGAARIDEERGVGPIEPHRRPNSHLREMESGVLDVAEDPLLGAAEEPDRAGGERLQDSASAEDAVAVVEVVDARGEAPAP